MGGFAALLKNQPELLLVGILGSTIGAFVGWLSYLTLSLFASSEIGKRMLEYQVGGLTAVRDELKLAKELAMVDYQMRALQSWGDNFRRLVAQQKNDLIWKTTGDKIEPALKLVIEGWLTSITDVFNLILELAHEKDYKSRIAIVVFGNKGGKPVGKYWIRYSGALGAHRDTEFDDSSIAYQVLRESLRSPCFTTIQAANKDGQNRPGGQSYKSFITFRINPSAVMVLDWPGELREKDPRVEIAEKICHQDLVPAIRDTLVKWSEPLQREVKLDELPTEA